MRGILGRLLARAKEQKGFTLVELMVVIVILGMLAVMVVPKVASQLDTAKEKRIYADLKNYASALDLYYYENNFYPAENNLSALEGTYLKKVQNDPWNRPYIYNQLESGKKYELYSTGSDGSSHISLE